jgi:Tfp pilus assembly protein PilN
MQSSFFSKGFKVMVGFILGILLVNFLIFNHYFKKEQEVSASLEMNRNYIEKIKSLKEDIKTKEERVKIFSRTNASKSSILLNEITKNIPTSILLKNLSYHPLQKKIKEKEPILTDDNALIISGESIDRTAFTNWITYLENLTWISSVSIVKYGNENGKEESFEIKVILNDETQQ